MKDDVFNVLQIALWSQISKKFEYLKIAGGTNNENAIRVESDFDERMEFEIIWKYDEGSLKIPPSVLSIVYINLNLTYNGDTFYVLCEYFDFGSDMFLTIPKNSDATLNYADLELIYNTDEHSESKYSYTITKLGTSDSKHTFYNDDFQKRDSEPYYDYPVKIIVNSEWGMFIYINNISPDSYTIYYDDGSNFTYTKSTTLSSRHSSFSLEIYKNGIRYETCKLPIFNTYPHITYQPTYNETK